MTIPLYSKSNNGLRLPNLQAIKVYLALDNDRFPYATFIRIHCTQLTEIIDGRTQSIEVQGNEEQFIICFSTNGPIEI